MRIGAPTLKRDGPSTAGVLVDWLNLPQGTDSVCLSATLHDADLVSIQSDLLQRTMSLHFESEHMRSFHHLPEGFNFVFSLQAVQSARVVGYAIWPGEFSIPPGVSREQESQLVEEYQSKWREESLSWTKFEGSITRENEQVLDISDASLAISPSGGIALQLCGHLNHAVYHEVFVRAETLEISGTDGTRFDLEKFQRMGELYWEAFSRDLHCHVCGKGPDEAKTLSKIGSAYICESCNGK